MIKILSFNKNHIKQAREIALANYNEERSIVESLPRIDTISAVAFEGFVDNGLGVAMFDGEKMLGFLCCDDPWGNAFGTSANGTFAPIHAHGAISENRSEIYKRLYQAAAEIWVDKGINYHAISVYTHNSQAVDAFFSCGFGLRCVDAIRPLINFEHSDCEGIIFEELTKMDVAKVREMRNALSIHLGKSPCFMRLSLADRESWIARAEARDSRVFATLDNGKAIAFIEVTDDGENFATWDEGVQNICGAFCLPEYRGKGMMQGLLNHVITQLKADVDINSLGVDFESFNLSSNGFWLKYFTAYTSTVTRRIDECALCD